MSVARCSFLVLGEDSADDAHATLVAVAKKLLRQVDPYYDEQHVRFEPLEGADVKAIVRGNLWKSEKPEDYAKRLSLIRYLATKLLEGERAFVLYHIDGDRVWAERDAGENVAKFRAFIAARVQAVIEHELRRKGRPVEATSLSQLLLLVPHYSIEAWLFQSTEHGRKLCREHASCRGEHVGVFDRWEADRGRLDEESKPKEMVCFKGHHNRRLAESLDVDVVYYAEKSLHAAVNELMASAPLVRALAATRPG